MADLDIVRVPNIEFSGFYFPQIAARLRQYARVYAPEITNEDLREVFIQMERAFSLVGHYNNVLLDMVANESFLPTANLPESVKLMLQLIDYKILPASPAVVDIVGKLNRQYITPTTILQSYRKFATERTADVPEIVFENDEAIAIANRTDQISEAFSLQQIKSGTAHVLSLDSDVIVFDTGDDWALDDLNKYMIISNSNLGNASEDMRIVEVIEDDISPGDYTSIRLASASFISETGLTWSILEQTENLATDIDDVGTTDTPLFTTAPEAGDRFLFGHSDVMWDRFDLAFTSDPNWSIAGVWEFYDNNNTAIQPDSVSVGSGNMGFALSTLLGVSNRAGSFVRVMHVPSGNEVKSSSTNVLGINILTISGYLGQTTPSTNASDYLVFADWRPIDTITDTTIETSNILEEDGYVEFNLPQNQTDIWQKYTVYDRVNGESREAYYLRYRVVANSGGATAPDLTRISITEGEQYISVPTVQGKTVEDNPIGSSSGEPSQEFTLAQTPYIYNSLGLRIDEGGGYIPWTRVDSFLTSFASDRHYTVDARSDGSAVIKFGDGINGKIPPIGTNNISGIYRIGADEDGNVGSNTVTVNRDGVGTFRNVYNPRAAKFWVEADWASVESLERIKERGPLHLRVLRRAITTRDCEILAESFRSTSDVRPVARAKAYEESYGPKTIELVVAGYGGAALSADDKQELSDYFNGGDVYDGVLIANHEMTVTNYTPTLVGLNVEVTAFSTVTESMILQTLTSLLSATAVESDQTTYVWSFGQEVPLSRITAEIFRIAPGSIFKVKYIGSGSDISLGERELPILDVTNTTVSIIDPNF